MLPVAEAGPSHGCPNPADLLGIGKYGDGCWRATGAGEKTVESTRGQGGYRASQGEVGFL